MKTADYVRLLLLSMIWGASFLFMRIAAPAFGANNTAFLRAFFGCIGLIVILVLIRQAWDFKGKFKLTLCLGIINSGLPFLLYSLAYQWLAVGYSAVLNATTPLMGALVGFLFFGERISHKKWAGIGLGMAGIISMTTQGEIQDSEHFIAGILACLMATCCYGFTGFLTRRWIAEQGGLDSKMVAFGSQIGASLFLLPFFIWSLLNTPDIQWQRSDAWISVLAVGFICTALAYILFFKLIENIGPLKTLTVTFLIPPFGIIWGYLVLGETITASFLAGSILIGLSVWMMVSPDKSK